MLRYGLSFTQDGVNLFQFHNLRFHHDIGANAVMTVKRMKAEIAQDHQRRERRDETGNRQTVIGTDRHAANPVEWIRSPSNKSVNEGLPSQRNGVNGGSEPS